MGNHAIDVLRRNWGESYEIGTDEANRPRACRLDSLEKWITADTVDELNVKIVDDYTSRPVRNPAAGQ
jgi:hypothetical protein